MKTYQFKKQTTRKTLKPGERWFYSVYFLDDNGKVINYPNKEQRLAMREAKQHLFSGTVPRNLIENRKANQLIAQKLANQGFKVLLSVTIGFYL